MYGSASSASIFSTWVMKYGTEIAAVELHPVHDLKLGLHPLRFLDGDDAFVADLLHRLRDQAADLGLAIRADRADLGGLRLGGNRLERRRSSSTSAVTALSTPRRTSSGASPAATARPPSRTMLCASTIAVVVPSPASRWSWSRLRAELGSDILGFVGKRDLFCDGDAVLGHARRAVALVQQHGAALRTERHLDRIRQHVDAAQQMAARVRSESHVFGCHVAFFLVSIDMSMRHYARLERAKRVRQPWP